MRRRIILQNNKKSGNDWVDLGLPSGLLWATHNVGAESETDYGNYYQYGKGSRDYFVTSGESNYTGAENPLALSADTAYQAWGDTWRMPTSAECAELIANTTYQWTNINGVNGGKFVSTADTTQYIFIPAAGMYRSGSLYEFGIYGYIRSSTPSSSNSLYSYILSCYSGTPGVGDGSAISYAIPIRPVRDNSAWPVGNVLFYNTVSQTKKVFQMLEWPEASDGWTPIGIEVVPKEHDRYGDGSGGFISLVTMSYNTPESGDAVTSSSQRDGLLMYWGSYNATIGNNIFKSSTYNATGVAHIPHQAGSATTATTTATTACTQWPYDGTYTAPTSAASTTTAVTVPIMTATTGHVFGDFNGIKNTAAIYVKTRTAAQWTASTVENATGSTNTPAAACAGRYKTVGTKSFLDVYSGITSNSTSYGTTASTKENTGYWYLPGVGEMCYLPSKKYEIRKVSKNLNAKYGNVSHLLDINYQLASSSEKDSNNFWFVSTKFGQVTYSVKHSSYYVRAFLRYKDGD